MATFSYKARNAEGVSVNGLVEAPTISVAARLLRDKRLFIITITEQSTGFSFGKFSEKFHKTGLSDVTNITRQMATMAVAGLSLPESLAIIRSQSKNQTVINLLLDIEHQLTSGATLSDALSKHGDVFSSIYVALVKAGEASGNLDKILTRLAENLESEREFRAKVQGALMYPVIIILGMVAVVFIMMTFVIPKLTDLYTDFGVTLPLSTRMLVFVSQIFARYWILILLGTGLGGYGFSKWKKTPVGQYTIDTTLLKIPYIGALQTNVILTEFTRSLGMLVGSGIHILDCLNYLKDSMGNILFRKAVREISERVEKGFPIGESFGQYELFPAIVPQMMKVGEETGKLDDSLLKLSIYFEKEAEHMVKNLTTVMEPFILVMLGLGVGFIVFSIVTPMYSLTNQIK